MQGRPIRVRCQVGEAGAERPLSVVLRRGEPELAVLGVDDRWYDGGADYWRVRLADGHRALLRHDLEDHTWSLLQHVPLDA